ncbi:MAG: alpha/beta hydrolase family protein [Janthinobacterium lividum]
MQKLLLLLLGLTLWASGASHAKNQKEEPTRLNGQWQGPLKVPGGALTLMITIVPLSNGTYYAALDVPQQRISRMPVEVELKGDDLTLRIEQAGSHFEGKVLAGGDKLSGTWEQPGLKTDLVLERSAAPAAALAAKKLRLTPPYRESEVTFLNPTGKLRLSGTLTIPSGEGPFAAVALLSDSGPQERDSDLQGYHLFGILADYLTRHGIAVLRFDDRGVGRSGGDYTRATTADLVSDAQAALAFLRKTPLIAPQQVGLIGHGEGANVALLAAAQPQNGPAFVASLAGYGQPGRDVLRRQQGEIMRLIGTDGTQIKAAQALYDQLVDAVRQTPNNTAARAKVVALLRSSNTALSESMARARAVELTSPWSRYFIDFNPATGLPLVQCPVLLLNGTADLQVAAGRNLSVLQKGLHLGHAPVEVHRLSGVNHWFQPDPSNWPIVAGERQAAFSPEGLDYLRTWLLERAKLAKAPLPVTVQRAAPKPKPASAVRSKSRRPVAGKVRA